MESLRKRVAARQRQRRIFEGLLDNLNNLTITAQKEPPAPTPEYPSMDQKIDTRKAGGGAMPRRKGVRTLLMAQIERRQKMLRRMYQFCNPNLRLHEELNRKDSEDEGSGQRFQCGCSYCEVQRELVKKDTPKTDAESDSD